MTKLLHPKIILCSVLILTLGLQSCFNKQNNIYTHSVKHTDFEDKLYVIGELQPSNTKHITCPRLRADATIIFLKEHGKWVKKGDTVCILEAKKITSKYEQAENDLKNAEAEYKKTEAQQNLNTQLLFAQKENIEASEAITRLDSVQQKFVSEVKKRIIDLKLEKARLEKQKVINRLSRLKGINKSELNQKNIRIKQAKNKLKSAQSLLDKLILKAPSSGTLLRAKRDDEAGLLNLGDIVWGGMPIVNIPNTETYQVKFNLTEREYKKIEKGFLLESVSQSKDSLSGEIKTKSPIGRPIKKGSNVKLFEVTASVNHLNFKPRPGQSIACNIITKKIPKAYIIPLLSVFKEDSIQLVYVSSQNKFEKRPIKITYKNATQAVVIDGFKIGEKVALSIPHKRLILKKPTPNE